jgi:MarR family transcriptional regulator, transcriptional regulator for hemolysin
MNKPDSIGYWALRLHHAHHSLMQQELSEHGISAAQAYFLTVFGRYKKAVTMTEIAKDLGFSHPAIVRHVNELVKLNLVEKVVSEDDRRARLVKLTDSGKEKLPIVQSLLKRVKSLSEEGLEKDDLEKTYSVLIKTHKNIINEIKKHE